ncbi:MAG: O-antigen ligase family protein [Opitutae bacterium]|nr:O-antigen ligase family protein [Opitutae bacterium]
MSAAATPPPARLARAAEWLLVVGLAVTLAWTTLCLGGYRAETMVLTSWAVFALAALGGGLWFFQSRRFNRAALLPVPFLLFALASVLWLAPAQWLAWREWLLWLQMWLVFVLALHFGRSRGPAWVLVGTFVLLGLVGAGMAAYQRFADPKWMMLGRTQAEQFVGRSAGMFGIPNSLAGLLELMIPACLALLWSRAASLVAKLVCGWLAAVFVFALVLTGSRGGWIALALALAAWPLLIGGDWRKKLAGSLAVLALAAGGVAALYHFSPYARGRIAPFLTGEFESSRPLIWRVGVAIWREHPWLGSGAGSYNVVFEPKRPRGFLNETQWTHNDYLNTLSDYGLAGIALWFAAGAALLWFGWRAVRRARREPVSPFFALWRWKLGLWLGLVAYALHLGVDFHTKLPALAFAAAVAAALLLRDEEDIQTECRGVRWLGILGSAAGLVLAWRMAAPLYRAEALREEWRYRIDKLADGQGRLDAVVPSAQIGFQDAVKFDPANGRAWADLAYAIALSWHVTPKADATAIGRRAEAAADRALALCPVSAEYWVRKGVALDMQRRPKDAETAFRRALALAPRHPEWHYYWAYHLSTFPERKAEAAEAVATCLSLDPANSAAVALRERLKASR